MSDKYDPYVPPTQSVRKKRKPRKGRRKSNQKAWCAEMRKQPCHYCGAEPAGTIDHKIPKAMRGTTTPENCVPACGPCNAFRGHRSYDEFKNGGWKARPFA